MAFTGAVPPPLLHATPHPATKIIATANDNRHLREGVIKPPFSSFGLVSVTDDPE
jgi:hypothetical protein